MIEQKAASSIQNKNNPDQGGFVLQVQDLNIRSRNGEKLVSGISFQIESRGSDYSLAQTGRYYPPS